MTHPCNECDFIATSARQLSRHKAVTHVKNPLKCVLCPFVTAYQTNLLRHRREVHGILGSKGHKSCKFCSFQADDNDKLILHQQQAHQDILKSARERFAREKKSARGACNNSDNSSEELDDQYNSTLKMDQNNLFDFANLFNKTNLIQSTFLNQPDLDNNNSNVSLNQQDDDDDRDFWKEGFIDNPASLINFNQFNSTTTQQQQNFTNDFLANFQKQFQNFNKSNNQFDLNGLTNFNNDLNALNCFSSNLNSNKNLTYQDSSDSDPECSNTNLSRPASRDSNIGQQDTFNNEQSDKQMATASVNKDLAPTKIRRQYICQDCDFRTVNPREFLYHRRDVHDQKVKIVECPYCVYACQYFQKLQRHMLLVHKLKTSITPPTENSMTPSLKPLLKEQTNITNQSQNSTRNSNGTRKSTSADDKQLASISGTQNSNGTRKSTSADDKQLASTSKTQNTNGIRKSTSADDKQLASTSGTQNTNGIRQPGQIKCKYCQFLTDSFSKLEKHENTFHLEKRFRCPFCEIKFENLVWLQRHLVHMHNNNEKAKVILDVIESIMPRRKRVKANQNNNSSSTPNDVQGTVEFDEHGNPIIEKDSTKCPICSYETKWFSELQKHIRVHTNEKPYSCQLCSFRTKWKGDLNRHINKYHAKAISELKDQGKLLNSANNSTNNNQRSKRKLANSNTNLKDEEIGCDEEEEDEEQQLNNDGYLEEEDEEELNTNDNLSSFANNDTEMNDLNNSINDNEKQIKNNFELSANQNQQQSPFKVSSTSVTLRNLNEVKVKVYKCSYCDFICNTASRFHVHYVQHLNTKPFMCSACECRSNYEWDIVKHIKMKVQKGEDGDVHVGAKAILVHPSGNRDYKKYDKYLTMINKNDIDGNGTNQQDTRGLIDHSLNLFNNNSTNNLLNSFNGINNLSNLINSLNSSNQTNNQNGVNDDLDNTNIGDDLDNANIGEEIEYDLSNGDNLDPEDDEEYFNSEEVIIEPDINFSIGNEMDLSINQPSSLLNSTSAINSLASSLNQLNNLNTNLLNNSTCSTTSSNNTNSTNKPSKLFYCAYCDYTHRDSKSLVSHLSKHAGKKPFKCRICNLASNWREVLNRHVSSRHSGTSADIEQLFKYTVSKYICRIIDDKGQLNLEPEITTKEKVRQSNLQLNGNNTLEQSSSSNFTNNIKNNNSNSFLNNLQDFNQQQNSLMMLNSILAQQLSNCDNLTRLSNSASSLLPNNQQSSNLFYNLSNLSGLSNLANNKSTSSKAKNSNSNAEKPKPKVVETPEVLAAHGITGRVSGFKGEYKCDKCPFRAEKAFHMDFHSKRHVQAPGAEHKCPHCDFWVHAKKSLVKHIYLHKYDNN